MNSRFGCLAIVLFLTGMMLGGCPTNENGDDLLDDLTPNASDNSGDNNDDSGSSNAGDNSDNSGQNNDEGQNSGVDQNDDGGGNDGQNNDGGDENGEQSLFAGAYSGTVKCTKSESLGGPLGLEQSWNAAFDIAFDGDGAPVELTVPGYGQAEGGIVFLAQISQAGDTVTLTETSGSYTATLKVTVTQATYNADNAQIVLQLEHTGVKGALTEDGTGVCTIEYEMDGNDLDYSSVTEYNVKLSGMIDTIWHVEHEGTLAQ